MHVYLFKNYASCPHYTANFFLPTTLLEHQLVEVVVTLDTFQIANDRVFFLSLGWRWHFPGWKYTHYLLRVTRIETMTI